MYGLNTPAIQELVETWTTTPVYRVEYYQLEGLVNEYFHPSVEWSFVADQEAGNDEARDFIVTGKLTDDDHDAILDWVNNGDGDWMAGQLLAALCYDGVIQPGTYLIGISW